MVKWKLLVMVATPLLLIGCDADAPAAAAVETVADTGTIAPARSSAPAADAVPILALGDSLFAGYGLAPGQSYPARLETALQARGIPAQIVNAGVSGDTTAGGLARTDFVLKSMPKKPALAIISLGGNDLLRAVPPAETRRNLAALLAKFAEAKIPVVVMGMLAPPNLGADYARQFNALYPALAKQHGAKLVPFFLQPLLGHPELVQADHIHPTLPGIDRMVAYTLDEVATALPKPAAAPRLR